jgi:WD40 repeat protein
MSLADKFQNPENLLRGRIEAHKANIVSGDFAPHLDLIATGGRDNKARLWDYERIMSIWESPDNYHKEEVTMVRFIRPFPLLLSSDTNGQLYIWLTKPHPHAGKLIVDWRNNYTLQTNCPITAIDTYYNEENGTFLLLIGDEMGTVRV